MARSAPYRQQRMTTSPFSARPRIVLADPHDASRSALARVISESWGWEVVAEVHDGIEAASVARRTSADVVLADVGIRGLTLSDLCGHFERAGRPVVVGLCDFPNQLAMIRCPAVLKGVPPEHLREVIETILAGPQTHSVPNERPIQARRGGASMHKSEEPIGLLYSLLGGDVDDGAPETEPAPEDEELGYGGPTLQVPTVGPGEHVWTEAPTSTLPHLAPPPAPEAFVDVEPTGTVPQAPLEPAEVVPSAAPPVSTPPVPRSEPFSFSTLVPPAAETHYGVVESHGEGRADVGAEDVTYPGEARPESVRGVAEAALPAPVAETAGVGLAPGAQLFGGDVAERRVAVQVLLDSEPSAEVADLAASVLGDPNLEVRLVALQVLERSPELAPTEVVVKATLDPDARVRARALALLGRSGRLHAVSDLARSLATEQDDVALGAALTGVANLLESSGRAAISAESTDELVRAVGDLSAALSARFRRELGSIAIALGEGTLARVRAGGDASVRRGAAVLAACMPGTVATEWSSAAATEAFPYGPGTEAGPGSEAIASAATEAALVALYEALSDPSAQIRAGVGDAIRLIPPLRVLDWVVARLGDADDKETARLLDLARHTDLDGVAPDIAEIVLAAPASPGGERARQSLVQLLATLPATADLVETWLDSNDEERRISATHLAASMGTSGRHALVRALSDPSSRVRLAAVRSFAGDVIDADAGRALLRVVETDSDPDVRTAAVTVLSAAEPSVRKSAVDVALSDFDARVRVASLALIMPASEETSSFWSRFILDPDPTVAKKAVDVLASAGGADVVASLWMTMHTAPQATREIILDALVMREPSVTLRLAAHAFESVDPTARVLGLAALIRLEAPRLGDRIAQALSDPAREVRLEALHSLTDRPALVSIESVARMTSDPDIEVRQLAVQVLAASDDERATPALLDAARDPSEAVQSLARTALLDRRSTSLVQLLTHALESQALRQAAAELLGQMVDRSTTVLISALPDAGPEARQAIVNILDTTEALRVLTAQLDDRHVDTRLGALEGLSVLQSRQAVGGVVSCLDDPDSRVRRRAAGLLGELGDPRAAQRLRATLTSDPDLSVVEAAESALRRLDESVGGAPGRGPGMGERP